jgi:hypothetical protein
LQCNNAGLTGLGRFLIERMIADHMLIEVDHLSGRRATRSCRSPSARTTR